MNDFPFYFINTVNELFNDVFNIFILALKALHSGILPVYHNASICNKLLAN